MAVVGLVFVTASAALAQDHTKASDATKPTAIKASELTYNDISVKGFDAGLKIAVLYGDPSQAAPYTLRLKFPDGYAFPPHWHPNLENVTVVTGTFYLGMGDTVDKSAAAAYQPGDYLVAPARMSHFGWVKGETVVQLHGIGPFDIKLAGEK
jgi:quercetin dioxygenase-like cupin family protein